MSNTLRQERHPVAASQDTAETIEIIDLLKFIPPKLRGAVKSQCHKALHNDRLEISRPVVAFASDDWTRVSVAGFSKVDMRNKRGQEVGVGIGTITGAILAQQPEASIVVSDYVGNLVRVTEQNLHHILPPEIFANITFQHGNTNLLDKSKGQKFDAIFACIPQVSQPKDIGDLNDADHRAHYFSRSEIPEELLLQMPNLPSEPVTRESDFLETVHPADFDLDLITALLLQAKQNENLNPDGAVYLTLGGRPGWPILQRIIQNCGYNCEIIHQETVVQHRETDISPLADHEAQLQERYTGYNSIFYEDIDATKPIGAKRAHDLRTGKPPVDVYHDIFVVKATLAA